MFTNCGILKKIKDLVNKWLTFVIFKNYYDSPYVKAYSHVPELEPKVKLDVFDNKSYIIPDKVRVVETEFNETLQNSLLLRFLMSSRKKIDSIREYYENSLADRLR